MAQKKGQYTGAADSIFDFIFSSNRYNAPQKARPGIPGVAGDEMAYALGEIASAPALYVNEQALNVINEPLGEIEVAKLSGVKLDDSGNKLNIATSRANFANFLTNPEGFVNKAYERMEGGKKASRELAYIRGLGGVLDLGIGAVLARSAGSPPGVSLETGMVLGSEFSSIDARNIRAEENATRASALEAAKEMALNYDEANLLAQSFNSVMESATNRISLFGVNLGSLSGSEKTRLERLVKNQMVAHGVSASRINFDVLFNKYIDRAKKYGQIRGYDWQLGTLDKGIASKNYFKSKNLDITNPEHWILSENPADKDRALKYETLRAEAELLSDSDSRKRAVLMDMERIKIWQESNGDRFRFARFLGETHLNLLALKTMVWEGGAIPGMISGDFFDMRKNNLAPSAERKFSVKLNNGEEFGQEIMMPRDDMNRVYGNLTFLYYLTPGSIGKTLFLNGEGFVYLEYLKQQKIQKLIKGSESLYLFARNNAGSIADLNDMLKNVDLNDQKLVLQELAKGGNFANLIAILNRERGSISDTKLMELLDKIDGLYLKLQNSKILKFYNKINALKGMLAKYNPINILKQSFGKLFVKVFGEKAKKFLVGGVISLRKIARALGKKLIKALASALGVAFGGVLGAALTWIATEIIYFFGEKALKVFVKIGVAIIWSLLLIFAVLMFGLFLGPNPQKDSNVARNIPPTHVVECVGGVEEELVGGRGRNLLSPREASAPPPKILGAMCPLQPSSVKCTQKPFGGFSHGGKNAIDVVGPSNTYWYAPSDGVITKSVRVYYNSRLSWQKCGGIVHFKSNEHGVTYVLVHVVPYVTQNQRVAKGTVVAKMSARGDNNINFTSQRGTCATGAHLHLEVWGSKALADRYYRETLCCNIGACPGSSSSANVPQGCGIAEVAEDCEGFKTFSGTQFKELGDRILGVVSTKPHITGNSAADSKIRTLAEQRGYKPRRDAGGFNSSARSAYESMAGAAKEENVVLFLADSLHYRTIDRQRTLFLGDLNKSNHCVQNNYANVINGQCDTEIDKILSARSIPGYSKHHTGFAIDLTCGSGGTLTGFASTECYKWMSKNNYCNAKKFGFIPSYPSDAGQQGPDPEPWEYVWVGVDDLKK